MIPYTKPTVSELNFEGIEVLVLHEYQNHPTVSGNKWWKLYGNLVVAKRANHHTIVTFGGAYSNHIYATAAAARIEGFKSIGIIRGEEVDNPVLRFARSQGMELRFVSREEYRRKTEMKFEDAFVIPEGGTNEYAIESCRAWGKQLLKHDFEELYVAVGTGGTMTGLTQGMEGTRKVIGVPVLKGMTGEDLLTGYDFGGYAKTPPELVRFCDDVKRDFGLIIEPVYTGKLFWAVFDQIKKKRTASRIMVIHTGGINSLLSHGAT